jgi:hypothetical protein
MFIIAYPDSTVVCSSSLTVIEITPTATIPKIQYIGTLAKGITVVLMMPTLAHECEDV